MADRKRIGRRPEVIVDSERDRTQWQDEGEAGKMIRGN